MLCCHSPPALLRSCSQLTWPIFHELHNLGSVCYTVLAETFLEDVFSTVFKKYCTYSLSTPRHMFTSASASIYQKVRYTSHKRILVIYLNLVTSSILGRCWLEIFTFGDFTLDLHADYMLLRDKVIVHHIHICKYIHLLSSTTCICILWTENYHDLFCLPLFSGQMWGHLIDKWSFSETGQTKCMKGYNPKYTSKSMTETLINTCTVKHNLIYCTLIEMLAHDLKRAVFG